MIKQAVKTISILDEDDDLLGVLTPTQQLSQVTSTSSKKRGGWPKRHLKRCAKYYNFFRIYRMLDSILYDKKYTDLDGSLPNFSDYEIKTLTEIKNKLEELRVNRFKEYFKMKEEEREKQYL